MATLLEELADKLAIDTLAAMDETGDDRLHEKLAKSIGAYSPTLEEAFLTSMRVRMAARRGQAELARLIARATAATTKG
jgi:hypothetical protein